MKRKVLTFIIVVILTLIFTITAYAYTGPAFVATDQLNVYDGGGWNCKVLDCLPRGTNVIIEADAGYGWYKISYDGGSGYVAGYYLLFGVSDTTPEVSKTQEVKQPVEQQQSISVNNNSVKGDWVNMRSGPSLNSTIIDCLPYGTAINIRGTCGEWYEIEYNGTVGYMYGKYVFGQTNLSNYTQELNYNTTGQDIINAATQYLGAPYHWGGESMAEGGFDCSGLVYAAYQQNGIKVNRVAQSMYQNGTNVELNSLQPGDILLFGSSVNNIWHVGIYMGNNTIIHSSYGDIVRTQSLDEIQGMRLIAARRLV